MNALQAARRLRPFVWDLSAPALVAMVKWWSPWTSADDSARPAAGAQPLA
jgi:hypothetical protein